ncbi:MAG: DUF1572 family protein [Bacteroidetes bacterium]|nr:DUF1572 family protein [Bacteroidota bacterium]
MSSYLDSITKQFEYYKMLGDKTFGQLNNTQILWQFNDESNSIAIIVKHIVGNMLSRWTNFLTEDGEKKWRYRDTEFEDAYTTKEDMLAAWEKGWQCLFNTIKPLTENDLKRIIYIRNQGHTVTEAINRQLSHYSYHIGQLIFVAKMIKGKEWQSLSIPKGKSKTYNTNKFSKDKGRRHFTDNL